MTTAAAAHPAVAPRTTSKIQEHDSDDGQGQGHQAGKREAVGGADHLTASALPKKDPMQAHGGNHQPRGSHRTPDGDQVYVLLECRKLLEPSLKRQREQKAGQQLYAGLDDS